MHFTAAVNPVAVFGGKINIETDVNFQFFLQSFSKLVISDKFAFAAAERGVIN